VSIQIAKTTAGASSRAHDIDTTTSLVDLKADVVQLSHHCRVIPDSAEEASSSVIEICPQVHFFIDIELEKKNSFLQLHFFKLLCFFGTNSINSC